MTPEGTTLQRYPLNIEQVVDPAPLFLLTRTLQDVVREGTARRLEHYLPADLDIAGKTGTSDGFRDSWFAGFSGDRLGVVWIGRDDNQSSGLTGASGAMTLWGRMMADLNLAPLILPQGEKIEHVWIDQTSGLRSAADCPGAIELPFISGSAPQQVVPCAQKAEKRSLKNWFKKIFGGYSDDEKD
jgi:penicillin-binding protein 1B